MLTTLRLLAPALIPSWNFFDAIGPSPRIEYALSPSGEAAPGEWREFRPRPERVSLATMLGRLVWNARWNETLFVVSCAERLINEPTAHSESEIFARIAGDLGPEAEGAAWLRFRLLLVAREGEAIVREEVFVSAARPVASLVAP